MTSVIKPPALRPGDTIGVAAPASAFDKDAFQRGIRRIQNAGYRTFFRPDIFSRSAYLAGTDERRADELRGLFADRTIRAIFCARGGYGSQRIIPMLDAETIRVNPKIFMGYSDITALHAYFRKMCDLVTFHGPFITELGAMAEDAFRSVFRTLAEREPWGELTSPGIEVLREGKSDGVLTGGSLSVFAATIGTPYETPTADAILFFEDRGEKPYAVDRLFSHLKLAGKFSGAKGLILGQFIPPRGLGGGEEDYQAEVKRIVLDAVGAFRFPVLARFPAGHFMRSICFPLGARAAIDGERGTVTITEPCLSE
jgi:muramoyltetrapeptide carboxypeptidase